MSVHLHRRSTRRAIAGFSVATLALVACGSSDDASSSPEPATGVTVVQGGADGTADGGELGVGDGGDGAGAVGDATATTALPEVNILTDFADVCRGTTLPGATPYDSGRAGVHPVMYAIGEDPAYDDVISSMPTTWDPVTGQEFTTELVACIARTDATLVQTCEGYESDDVATGNVVETYDATYEVRLLVATTGEELGTTTIEASAGDCPLLFFFDDGETVGTDYADPGDQLTAWLAPFVET